MCLRTILLNCYSNGVGHIVNINALTLKYEYTACSGSLDGYSLRTRDFIGNLAEIILHITKRVELLNGCVKQQAVGSQGSRGTLNQDIVLESY